jgi:alpha-soluble NSF attachment protein
MAGGQKLVAEAEKKLKGGFFSCLGGTRRFEEASDIYQQAATQFKLVKEWQEAANCYIQCAFCSQKCGEAASEASFHTEAAHVLKKISTAPALEEYEQAVAILPSLGKFGQAGKLLTEMAELVETEDSKNARSLYQRAVEMFDLDDHSKSNASKCRLKVAEFAAAAGDYEDAIAIFESEGEKALENSMLQFGAKDHFLRAGILHLVMGDSGTVNLAVEKYESLDPRFAASREGELLRGLAQAFEALNVEAFEDALREFDAVSRLDGWKTKLLIKAKEHIAPAQGLGGDETDLT